MIFGKGKLRNDTEFKIGNTRVDIVDEYKYLGVLFSKTGSFVKTKKILSEQANKAMFSILKKAKTLSLPYDIQIELFEKTVKPVLLYACEIWGFGNIDILERTQLKFFKYIFKMKKSTPSYMIYGELGLTPLSVDIKSRIVTYWARIIDDINCNTTPKLSSKMYTLLYQMHLRNPTKCMWINNVKDILCASGFSGIWESQSFVNSLWLKKPIHLKARDIFIQQWYGDLNRSSGTNLYKHIKDSFVRSNFINTLPTHYTKTLILFRTRNHRLPVETGRWQNIPHNERKCTTCNLIGDEYHFLMECKTFATLRNTYLPVYYRTHSNFVKFTTLFKSDNYEVLKNLAILIFKIMKKLNSK